MNISKSQNKEIILLLMEYEDININEVKLQIIAS